MATVTVDVIGLQELAELQRTHPELYPIFKRIFDLLEQIRANIETI